MSADAFCEQSPAPTVTPTIFQFPTVCRPKKVSEAKVAVDAVCASKIQHCSRKEVTSSRSKPSRKEVLDAKRDRLRRLFEYDAIDLENSLRELGYAFVPTQP